MIVKRNKEKGALAIDAILGIVMFIFTVLGIMFLALMIRVQANMQYALSQTAKEISGYFYFLDKVGLTSTISGSYEDIAADVNQNIGLVVEFAGGISDTVEDVSDATSVEEIMDILNSNSEDLNSQLSEIEAMLSDYTKDDVAKQMKAVLQIFGRTMINKAFGEIVAPLACKVLMPKYLTRGDINEYYESMGIDPDKVKFSGSEMLKDGRSIKLVCSYELDLSKYTFGLVHKTMKFQQIAATAAWVKPNDTQSIRRIQDILEAPSAPPETSSTPSSDTPTDVTTTEASTSDSVTTTTVPTSSDNSTTTTTPIIIIYYYDTTTSTTLNNIISTSTVITTTTTSTALTTTITTTKVTPISMDPKKIRFSQTSCNGAGPIIESMKENGWAPPPNEPQYIDVVLMPDGGYTTIDNTRLYAAQQAGIEVMVVIHDYDEPLPDERADNLTTTKNGRPTTWGEGVDFRIKKQNRGFPKNYPYGSYEMMNPKL